MVGQGYPSFDDESAILFGSKFTRSILYMLFMLYIIRYYIYTFKIAYNNTSMNWIKNLTKIWYIS